MGEALDEHFWYSVKDLALLWNMDHGTIRNIFLNEPGVIVYHHQQSGKRMYRTIRIPGNVALRVQLRMTVN